MNRKLLYFAFVLLGVFLLFASCRREKKFSEIPYIEFVSIYPADPSTGMDVTVCFKFQDGDGNIGLDEYDTYSPFDTSSVYYYNCIIDYFEKQNGTFVRVELPSTLNLRIPRLSKKLKESIEGELYIDLYANNPFSKFDTIRYDITILDRDLNYSNTITTSEYIVNK